jgi:hypothetical protein
MVIALLEADWPIPVIRPILGQCSLRQAKRIDANSRAAWWSGINNAQSLAMLKIDVRIANKFTRLE